MNQTNLLQTHDEIDRLLPWYVNDTLGDAERALVAAHIAACRECRDNVAFLKYLQHGIGAESLTPLVPAPRPEELLDAIDRGNAPQLQSRWPRFLAAAGPELT